MAGTNKASEVRRWLGIVLRAVHLAAVTLLGAQLLGAGGAAAQGATWALVSGGALFVAELADGRVRVAELAGAVVVVKLGFVAWIVVAPESAAARAAFWAVLVVSALSSHAPRRVRHWPKRESQPAATPFAAPAEE